MRIWPTLHHQNPRSVSFRSYCYRSPRLSFIAAAALTTSAAIRSQIGRGYDPLSAASNNSVRAAKLACGKPKTRQDCRSPSSASSIFWHHRPQQLPFLSLRREEVTVRAPSPNSSSGECERGNKHGVPRSGPLKPHLASNTRRIIMLSKIILALGFALAASYVVPASANERATVRERTIHAPSSTNPRYTSPNGLLDARHEVPENGGAAMFEVPGSLRR